MQSSRPAVTFSSCGRSVRGENELPTGASSQSKIPRAFTGTIVCRVPEASVRLHSSFSGTCRSALRAGAGEGGAIVAEGSNGGDGGGGGGGGGGDSGGDSGSSPAGGPLRIMTVIFALAVIGGGSFAYIKKGSKMSLRASAGVGGALLTAAWLMGSYSTAGVSLALVTTVSLAVVMGKRYQASGKVMPAGALTIVAGIYSLIYSNFLLGSLI